MYNLNIDKLLILLTPTFLRKPKLVAWLRMLATPLHKVLYNFQRARQDDLYNLAPLYLGKVFLYQRGDYIDGGVDFIVVLPQGLEYDRYKLEALVNFYKLAGKRWTIEIK